jgi:hypothetical protein
VAELLEVAALVLLGGFFATGVLTGVLCTSISLSSSTLRGVHSETAANVSPDIAAQSMHVHPALLRHTVGAAAEAGVGDALTAGNLAGGELATPLNAGGEACITG